MRASELKSAGPCVYMVELCRGPNSSSLADWLLAAPPPPPTLLCLQFCHNVTFHLPSTQTAHSIHLMSTGYITDSSHVFFPRVQLDQTPPLFTWTWELYVTTGGGASVITRVDFEIIDVVLFLKYIYMCNYYYLGFFFVYLLVFLSPVMDRTE